ncbi:MAG: Nramp family divalent metal transporter [Pirellulales bacterium]|nr:Nramp family divalent metal transporter [Pirellulales bacterium]
MDDHRPEKQHNLFRSLLALLGPGLFLIGYNIGTGSVTTMASAGSRWGMQLTWVVLLSCVFVFFGVALFGRYTLATGETILYAIRRHFRFGAAISLFIMASVILGEFAGVAGMTALMVDILREWIERLWGSSFEGLPLVLTLAICATVFLVLWNGKYAFLEALLALLVGVMGFCFLVTAMLLVPSWRGILAGLAPGIPKEPDAAMIVAGMAGTTFSAAMLYCRSITIKAKGWGPKEEGRAWVDAGVSAVSMLFLSIAVMICAAGTLYVAGKPVQETVDMVRTLEPLAGQFALSLFVVGLVGAGLSSLIPTILIAPWLISDYRGKPIDPKSSVSRLFVVLGVGFGFTGPFIDIKPVALMVATMALLAIVLPFSTIAITVLLNQKHVGALKNTLPLNLICLAAVAFSLVMSYHGVIGFIEAVEKMLIT